MVKNGQFREDLYYRLNVINIDIIPLRNRMEDVILFINYFLNKINNEYITFVTIDDDALVCLQDYDWPGNIREALRKNDYNMQYTSEELGIHRSLLSKKIKKYQIEPK